MELYLDRFGFGLKRTTGALTEWASQPRICYTLEDAVRQVLGEPVGRWKVDGQTAIPVGRYRIEWTWSNRFKRMMIEVLGVEGFTGVRVHSGTDEGDTEGCILVGDQVTSSGISGGKLRGVLAMLEKKVKEALDRGEAVWLNVRGLP